MIVIIQNVLHEGKREVYTQEDVLLSQQMLSAIKSVAGYISSIRRMRWSTSLVRI